MTAAERIAAALPPGTDLAEAEREAILGIALLSIAADRKVNDDELAALRAIALRLGGEATADRADAAVDALLLRGVPERDVADERLRELAGRLGSAAARSLAYAAACALSRVDQDDADQEFEFDLQLIDALGLSQAEAERLAAAVTTALTLG